MASITPIIATQDTPQNDNTDTWVDCNCETSALANGVDYFVAYYGNCGSDSTSAVPLMRFVFGSTVIGDTGDEGRGNDGHWDNSECTGYAKITGNGTDTLKFQMNSNGYTVYTGAMHIMAMRLTGYITEGVDYWYSGTNDSGNEVSDASTTWETLRSQAFTLPDAGDYLVFMSAEMQAGDSDSADSAWKLRFYVDTTEICPTDSADEGYLEEWEDDTGWATGKISELVNLSSGSRTFKIECASRNSTPDSNFRRSRIWVFRKASFVQMVRTTESTGTSTTQTTYQDFSGLNTTFTPVQSGSYVFIVLHAIGRNSTYYSCPVQLYNDSDSTAHRVDAGEYNNGYGTGSGVDINLNASPIHCGQYTAAKNWKVQYRADGGTAYIGRNKNDDGGVKSNLIFWELATPEVAKEEALFYARTM